LAWRLVMRFRRRGPLFALRRAALGFAGAPYATASAAAASVRCFLAFGEGFGADAANLDRRDLLADQLLDRLDETPVIGYRQGESAAFAPGAAGATEAIDVILDMDRHVEIEHVRHALDV